jgi:hypothetical protein
MRADDQEAKPVRLEDLEVSRETLEDLGAADQERVEGGRLLSAQCTADCKALTGQVCGQPSPKPIQ